MRRSPTSRLQFLTVIVAALALAAPAAAAAPGVALTLMPNLAGRPSTLVISAEGGDTAMSRGTPDSTILSLQRGFRLDPRGVRKRCSAAQAQAFACPEASRIGSGQAVVTASGAIFPAGSQDFTATIDLFLAPPVKAGDVAGVVVEVSEPASGQHGTATGRLVSLPSGPFGYELRFDSLGGNGQMLPPGVTIALKRLDLRAGARRTVTRTRTVGQGKNRHQVKRRLTFSLLRNPSVCRGTWKAQVVLHYSDGSSDTRVVNAPCRSS